MKLSIPDFDGPAVAFGASLRDYPPYESIPEEFKSNRNRFNEITSKLFFNGGRLEDHGIRLKPDIDRNKAMRAIKAWLSSFDPKHEHKTATVAYALSEWCEDFQQTDDLPQSPKTVKPKVQSRASRRKQKKSKGGGK